VKDLRAFERKDDIRTAVSDLGTDAVSGTDVAAHRPPQLSESGMHIETGILALCQHGLGKDLREKHDPLSTDSSGNDVKFQLTSS
jgi:hypothetical protein